MDKSARFSLTSTPKEPARVSPLMDSNKARHDGKYVGDDITEITKKVRANSYLTDFGHLSGSSYPTDSGDFVDVCFGDLVDVGHLAGNFYPKEPARVSPLMDSNKAYEEICHEEICHDGIFVDVGNDITEIQTKLPANSYLTDFGHLSGRAMVSLQMDSNKARGDDITEIPTKVPANSYLTNLRDFVDVGHLSGSSYPKEPARVGPLMDSSQAREEICHDGKYVGDGITEIPTKLPANSYLTDFGHLSGSSYPTDLGHFVDVGHLSGSSYTEKPARPFPLMDSNKAHEEICHYGKYVGGDMTEIGSSYPTDFVDLGDCRHLKELPEICHDGKYGDDITEIPTKLPANSSLRDFEDFGEDFGDFMDLEESEAALSYPYLLIVDYIGKISETYTEGDGPGTDSSHDSKYIVEDITVIPPKRLYWVFQDGNCMSWIKMKLPAIYFPPLSLMMQQLISSIVDDVIGKISETNSEGDVPGTESRHDGIYAVKNSKDILTKLLAIFHQQLLTHFRELMVQQLISSSIRDEDIGKISETYLEGYVPGTESRLDGKPSINDITEIPTKHRDGVFQDGESTSRIKTELPVTSYQPLLMKLSAISFPRLFLPKQPVISFPLLSLIKQFYDDIYIDKISETYSEGHIVKNIVKDITEILTKLPAISYRQLSNLRDLRDLRELKAQPLISSSIIDEDITDIPTMHWLWVRVSQDGKGMSWIKTELHATSYQPLLKDLMDLREPAISFPPLHLLKQLPQLRISFPPLRSLPQHFSIIDVETYSYSEGHNGKYFVLDITENPTKLPAISYRPLLKNLRDLREPATSFPPQHLPELRIISYIIDEETYSYSEAESLCFLLLNGDVPGIEFRHDGKYLVLAITEIPTKLHAISFQELLTDLSDLRELTAQALISSSIIDEGITEIPTKHWVRVSQDGEGMSWIKTELPETSYQPLLKDLREPAISFPPLRPLKLLPQLRIDFSIIDEETYSNLEGDVPGTESRHDCKYVVLDITEIPTMLRDGVFQDDEGTSRIKTEPYQQLLTKLPAISFPQPFLLKPLGISFPQSFLPKLCAISLTKQPLISSSIIDDNIDKISETNSEVDVPGTESRREKNPEQAARRDKDLPEYSLYSSLRDGKEGETRVLAAAKGAAFLAHKSLSTSYWHSHEKVFIERPDVLERVKQDLLLALTKFALTIYDMEDFDRIVFKEDIKAERMKFLHGLDQTSTKTTEAILDIASGKMNFDKYCRLLERDVGNILELRERYFESSGHWNLEDYVADDYTWSSEDVNIPEPVIKSTIAVMKEMSPLKRNCAMHLMMELVLHSNCNCITDTLFHEFWRDIDVSRLEVFTLVSPNRLRRLLLDIIDTMSFLIRRRMRELCHSTFSATFPLVFGAFGDWSQDVIDVVQLADCERRWEGGNFIRSRHLLLGLLSSQITASVLEFGRFRDDRKESSICHVYEIYMVTEHVARMFGVNEIKLEHLFLAIMVVNLGINQHPQWSEDLQLTRNGLAVEEYIPAVQERMFCRFGIDFANLDTKAFVGNGISNERQKWDASMAIDKVAVFFKEREKFVGREERFDEGRWSVGCPLWDSVRIIKQLCKSHELPIIWENVEKKTVRGKLKIAEG